MKAVKILLVLLVVLALLLGGGVLYFNHYLQTPEFKKFVTGAARDALGSAVALEDINISLFTGVTVTGVTIANPEGFPGSLLTARVFVLRYRLLPLLRKRIEIAELTLQKPVVTLVRNDKNEWNYEKLPAAPLKPTPAPQSGAPSMKRGDVEISLSSMSLNEGEIVMIAGNKEVLRIDKIGLSSGLSMVGNKLSGTGRARIETISAGNSMFVRSVAAPVSLTPEQIKLAPVSGELAGGALSGDVAVQLAGERKYTVHLQVKDADVNKMLEEAGARRVLSGKLQLTAAVEGTGGLARMAGGGRAEVVGGKLAGVPLLDQLSVLLQVPALHELQFTECVMEFAVTNNVMQTPVIRLVSPEVQITGSGSVSLDDYSLNHNLTLAVAKDTLARAPKEVSNVFAQRADGFLTLDFRVWGPYDSPKTDLQARLVQGAAEQLLEKGLKKLLK